MHICFIHCILETVIKNYGKIRNYWCSLERKMYLTCIEVWLGEVLSQVLGGQCSRQCSAGELSSVIKDISKNTIADKLNRNNKKTRIFYKVTKSSYWYYFLGCWSQHYNHGDIINEMLFVVQHGSRCTTTWSPTPPPLAWATWCWSTA